MRKLDKLSLVGSLRKLSEVGGDGMCAQLVSSGALSVWAIIKSDVIITLRWWDPIVTLMRLLKPGLVCVFVADGHFSLLNLNKNSNKRNGKNIFESGYCDIYLLPDLISLDAVAGYPGVKYPYRPGYWDNPGICYTVELDECYDIVFVYGNDPFFDHEGKEKLFSLVQGITARFGGQNRICHVVPEGKNGKALVKGLGTPEGVFTGIDAKGLMLPSNAIYLCTPSTVIWRLVASFAKVAVMDVYDENTCFHPALKSISKPGDLDQILDEAEKYWIDLRKKMSGMLQDEELLSVIRCAVGKAEPDDTVTRRGWQRIAQHTLRDYLSSIWSLISKK